MLNVHIYPSPLTHESRILRITDALADAEVFDRIEVFGIARDDLPSYESIDEKRAFIRLPRKILAHRDGFLAKLSKNVEWSFRVFLTLRKRRIAAINAHSLAVLPLSAMLSKVTGAQLIYDTHELETETSGYRGLRQKLGKLVERAFIRRCTKVFVVSDSIADWYEREYRISRPTVVRNIPQFRIDALVEVVPAAIKRLQIPKDRILFIYQGGFIAGRGIERLLNIFARLSNTHLLCMGSGPLHPVVSRAAELNENIHLIPPVAPSEVLNFTRAADVGICLTDNSCLSHYYSLPNKIFEYLNAGLPIIVNPLKDQRELVEAHQCGWVAPEDDSALVELLRSIDRLSIDRCRHGIAEANRSLSWDNEKERLVAAYGDSRR